MPRELTTATAARVDELKAARTACVALFGRDKTELERTLGRAIDQLVYLDFELQAKGQK